MFYQQVEAKNIVRVHDLFVQRNAKGGHGAHAPCRASHHAMRHVLPLTRDKVP